MTRTRGKARRFAAALFGLTAGALLAGACGGSTPEGLTIEIVPALAGPCQNLGGTGSPPQFLPNPATVAVGMPVRFHNTDSRVHVIADAATGVTLIQAAIGTTTYALYFDTPGTLRYRSLTCYSASSLDGVLNITAN